MHALLEKTFFAIAKRRQFLKNRLNPFFTGCGFWCCTTKTRSSDPSFPFRSERVLSLPWRQSASSRSSRTCRKTHQLLADSFRLLVFPQSKQKLSHFASSCEQVPPNPKLKT
ncbi:hypothetical protein JHK82_042685 [Glycine max]|uniref:Uncharacterized protein n=1 Tax=Glycine max TaxID=3847 RepID=A0A0R0G944_SOYBN|nr:hypothetical protein JHK86_042711 [Glycine max]KAG4956961.1 hypothetical protein JHK85_043341 [Glycine max]KAG5105715.1 hypothetical protein JHK82_042685 [Glycine max]